MPKTKKAKQSKSNGKMSKMAAKKKCEMMANGNEGRMAACMKRMGMKEKEMMM